MLSREEANTAVTERYRDVPGRGEFARAQVHDGDEGLVEGLLEAGVLKEAVIDLRRIFGVELRRLVANGALG